MPKSEPQQDVGNADQSPSLDEILHAKQVLLRARTATSEYSSRYPMQIGFVPVKCARRLLLVVSMILVLVMGVVAILGLWDAVPTMAVYKVVLTCVIIFTTLGALVATNYYFGPTKWLTLEEQQEQEIV
jgi:hypothetical protein